MQEVYCFILPFVLKWLVAALIASVLVSLFSRLRRQGDRSSSSIYAQVCALLHEWLQSVCHHILSSKQAHLILVHLIGRGRLSAGVSKVTRYAGTDYRTVEKDQIWLSGHLCVNVSAPFCVSQGSILLYLTTLTLSELCLLRSFMWAYAHTFKLVWVCMHRSVGQHAIKGTARPAVIPNTRSVQLPGVLYTPATIQVRSMGVTLGTRQSTQIQGLHACVHALCSRFVSAAVHTCLSHLLQCRACAQATPAQLPLTVYNDAGSSRRA